MTRPAKVVIDIAALQHNLSRIRSIAPGSKVMAIVKADAYGHGIDRIAASLNKADAFGVACLEEARQLREAGIRQPVLLLEGPFAATELEQISRLQLDIVIHHEAQLEMLEQVALQVPLNAWLKIDTGMHRLGFQVSQAHAVYRQLQQSGNITADIRLMTHFACANEPGNPMTTSQIEIFSGACDGLQGERSLANSAAIINFPQAHADWVRPGIMLYGVSPMPSGRAADHQLLPVMSLMTELISIKQVEKGGAIGYGSNWRCPADMPVGIVAAGYGDGYPRHAESGTPILVNGQRTTIIGHVSMDMLAVDLRAVENPSIGDPVELWGSTLPIEEVAEHAGTIPYELMCGVQKRLAYVTRDE